VEDLLYQKQVSSDIYTQISQTPPLGRRTTSSAPVGVVVVVVMGHGLIILCVYVVCVCVCVLSMLSVW